MVLIATAMKRGQRNLLIIVTLSFSVAFTLFCVKISPKGPTTSSSLGRNNPAAAIRTSTNSTTLRSALGTTARNGRTGTVPSSFRGLTVSELPSVELDSVCTTLFGGKRSATDRELLLHVNKSRSDEHFAELADNCSRIVAERRYATRPANAEEAGFPLAFSILMYKDVEQFERLLRAVYRPQNIYCVNVEGKSPLVVHAVVTLIVRCFRNVFLLQPPKTVTWGKFSVLDAELTCMAELLKRNRKWKYFINLTGQEFPLKTNWQIVRILKTFNGSNNIDATFKRREPERYAGQPPPPFNLTALKGSVHIAAVRGFVEFAINDNRSKVLLDWVKKTVIPDETFFATLNHNPRILPVPGAYLGEPESDDNRYRFFTRFKNWYALRDVTPCAGMWWHRHICKLSTGDLPLLASRPELFANKFHADFEPLAVECMDQLIYRRLADQLIRMSDVENNPETVFNTSLYKAQDFVWNHL